MTQPAISPEAQSPFAMDPEKYSASKPGLVACAKEKFPARFLPIKAHA
ncbi:unnamed protein product [Penicillium camemberti]|uniref:Str. FM013 n=1 Tax=Penicillium camemberti (strain FM 013) TaxID=1429867 RepID=A0A0G4PUZ5_PENC3|nr:unnamed protein product [Penicillium camemberti]